MGHWTYGFVQINNELVLCEIFYNDKNQFFGLSPVSWKDIKLKRDRKMLIEDLTAQLQTTSNNIYEKDFNIKVDKNENKKRKR